MGLQEQASLDCVAPGARMYRDFMKLTLVAWRDLGNPAAGGAEVYSDRLLRSWVEMGHDVKLISAGAPGLAHEEEIGGYRIVRFGNRFSVFRQVRRALAESGSRLADADLIVEEVNTIPFNLPVIDGVRRGALVFQTCEDIWPHIAPRPLAILGQRFLEPRWMGRLQDVPTVTISESSRRDLVRFGLSRVRHVPMGRDVRDFPTRTKKFDKPTCIHVGRLVSYKRVQDVIDAACHLPQQFPGFQLIIVGDGPELSRLRRRAPSFVKFTGRVSTQERNRLMGASHLQVVTSVREGWGLIVTEAAEMGTPTLAYDVSGLRDSTLAAKGWVCPPDVKALIRWLPWALRQARNEAYEPGGDLGCTSWSVVARDALEHWIS